MPRPYASDSIKTQKLEQLHGFLTDIEVLRDAVWDNRGINDGKVAEKQDVSGSKVDNIICLCIQFLVFGLALKLCIFGLPQDGIEGLVTTLVARSGTPSVSVSTATDAKSDAAPGGVLDALRRFNDLLEACDVAVREGLEKG